MMRLREIVYGVAMFLIFGTALCADSLADTPRGFLIMFIRIGVTGILVLLGNRLEDMALRTKKRPPTEVEL